MESKNNQYPRSDLSCDHDSNTTRKQNRLSHRSTCSPSVFLKELVLSLHSTQPQHTTYIFDNFISRQLLPTKEKDNVFKLDKHGLTLLEKVRKTFKVNSSTPLLILKEDNTKKVDMLKKKVNRLRSVITGLEKNNQKMNGQYMREKIRVIKLVNRLENKLKDRKDEVGRLVERLKEDGEGIVDKEKLLKICKNQDIEIQKIEKNFQIKSLKYKYQILKKNLLIENFYKIVSFLQDDNKGEKNIVSKMKDIKVKDVFVKEKRLGRMLNIRKELEQKSLENNKLLFKRPSNKRNSSSNLENYAVFNKSTYNKRKEEIFIDDCAKGISKFRTNDIRKQNFLSNFNSGQVRQRFTITENKQKFNRKERMNYNTNGVNKQTEEDFSKSVISHSQIGRQEQLQIKSQYKLSKIRIQNIEEKIKNIENIFSEKLNLKISDGKNQVSFNEVKNGSIGEFESKRSIDGSVEISKSFYKSQRNVSINDFKYNEFKKKIRKLKEKLFEEKHLTKIILAEKEKTGDKKKTFNKEIQQLKASAKVFSLNEKNLLKDIEGLKKRLNKISKDYKKKKVEVSNLEKKNKELEKDNNSFCLKLKEKDEAYIKRFNSFHYDYIGDVHYQQIKIDCLTKINQTPLNINYNRIRNRFNEIKNLLLSDSSIPTSLERSMIDREISIFNSKRTKNLAFDQIIKEIFGIVKFMIESTWKVYMINKKNVRISKSFKEPVIQNDKAKEEKDQNASKYFSNKISSFKNVPLVKIKKNRLGMIKPPKNKSKLEKVKKEKEELNEQLKDFKRRLLLAKSKIIDLEGERNEKLTNKEKTIEVLKESIDLAEEKFKMINDINGSYNSKLTRFKERIKLIMKKYDDLSLFGGQIYDLTNKLNNLKEKKLEGLKPVIVKYGLIKEKLIEYHEILNCIDKKLNLNFTEIKISELNKKLDSLKVNSDFFTNIVKVFVDEDTESKGKELVKKLELCDRVLKLYKTFEYKGSRVSLNKYWMDIEKDLNIAFLLREVDKDIKQKNFKELTIRYNNIIHLVFLFEESQKKKIESFSEKHLKNTFKNLLSLSKEFNVGKTSSSDCEDISRWREEREKLKEENNLNLMNYKKYFDLYKNLKSENRSLKEGIDNNNKTDSENKVLRSTLKDFKNKIKTVKQIFNEFELDIYEENLKKKFLEKIEKIKKDRISLNSDYVLEINTSENFVNDQNQLCVTETLDNHIFSPHKKSIFSSAKDRKEFSTFKNREENKEVKISTFGENDIRRREE